MEAPLLYQCTAGCSRRVNEFSCLASPSTLRRTAYKADEMQVRLYGDAAVVTYRSSVAGTSGIQDRAPTRRRTTMLVKRGGEWLIVAQQSTPILTLGDSSR
jgi:ketosteroid isomerase-like protein